MLLWTFIYKFLWGHIISLGVELLGHMVILCLTLWGNAKLFSTPATPFKFPVAMYEDSEFSIFTLTLVILHFSFFSFSFFLSFFFLSFLLPSFFLSFCLCFVFITIILLHSSEAVHIWFHGIKLKDVKRPSLLGKVMNWSQYDTPLDWFYSSLVFIFLHSIIQIVFLI